MRPARAIAILCLALPAAAVAQVSYSQARIAGDPAGWPADYRSCMERNDNLLDRRAFLEQEKLGIERDAADIERQGERLREEFSRLASTDAAAVADYNRRSADQNRRVAAHNRRVAEMNAAASTLNNDTADLAPYCSLRTYRWRLEVPTDAQGEPRIVR